MRRGVLATTLLSTAILLGLLLLGPQEMAVAGETPKRGGTLNVGLHIGLLHHDWQSTVAHPYPHVMGHVFELSLIHISEPTRPY